MPVSELGPIDGGRLLLGGRQGAGGVTLTDTSGEVAECALSPAEYAAWVDWTDPLPGRSMGTPRLPGDGRRGSPRFAEMVANAPKSLSIAAALHPEVSDALDVAQRDAATEIRRWLAQHSVTRVRPSGVPDELTWRTVQSDVICSREHYTAYN